MALPPIVGRLIGDDSHFRGVMRGAVGAVGLLGGAFAAVGVGSFFKNAVMGASDLEEQLNKVNTVFGESVGNVTKFADQMAKDFGLSKTTILDAAGSIGLIGKASGLSQGAAAKMSTEMAKLAADASSFYNVPLEEALLAIRSGLVGEAEPMRRFGVLLSAEAVNAKAAAMGFKERNGQFDEGAKSQARAALIMEGMKDASGDLERTQGSLSNRLRELRGRFENFAAGIGAKAIPAVLKLLDTGEQLQKSLGPTFKTIGTGFNAMVGAFKDPDVTSDGFVGVMERIGSSARDVFDRVKEAWPQIQATIAGVVRFVVGLVQEHWPRIKEVVSETLSTLGAVISGWITFIRTIWQNFGSQITSVIRTAWDFILNIIDAALTQIRGVVDVFTGIITGDWSRVWDGLKSIFSGAWDSIKAILSAALDVIKELISVAWEIVKGIVTGAWDAIKGAVSAGIDAVVGFVAELPGRAWNAAVGLISTLWNLGTDALSSMKDAVLDGIANVIGFIQDIPGRAVAALGDLGRVLWEAGRKLISGFVDGIKSAFGWVKDTLGDLAGKLFSWKGPPAKDAVLLYEAGRLVIGGFVKGLESQYGAVKSSLGEVTSMIGGSASVRGSAPHIAGAGGGNVTVVLTIDGQEFARVMAPANRDALIDLGRHLPGGAFGAAA